MTDSERINRLHAYVVEQVGCGQELRLEALAGRTCRDNFLVWEQGHAKWILHTKPGKPSLQYQLSAEFQMYLESRGLAVAKTNGQLTYLKEVDCSVHLCGYLDACILEVYTIDDARALGSALGAMHRASLDAVKEGRFNYKAAKGSIPLSKRYSRLLQTIRGIGSYWLCLLSGREAPALNSIFRALGAHSAFSETLPRAYTHGDVKASNVLFTKVSDGRKELVGLIDFERANYRVLIADIADALFGAVWANLLSEDALQANREALLLGYQSEISLTCEELDCLSGLVDRKLNQHLLQQVSRWHRLDSAGRRRFLETYQRLRSLV